MGKTKEELREGNRRRQARWREKNRWLGEQRRLALYGKSKAQKAVTHNATRIEVLVPETGEVLKVWVDGRTKTGRILLLLWEQVRNAPVRDDPAGRGEEPATKLRGRPGVEVDLGI